MMLAKISVGKKKEQMNEKKNQLRNRAKEKET